MSNQTVAVIGAGPVGLEAALYAHALGRPVRLYERGRVGDNVRRWGHVRLFSPWAMNCSPLASRALAEAGEAPFDETACPTGDELVEQLLEPLARRALPHGALEERTRVVSVARAGLSKRAPLGDERGAAPFALLVEGPRGERIDHAGVVLDCTGTYGDHAGLGPGGLRAPGEAALGDVARYVLEPIDGAARGRYSGRRVLLVGAGASAATAVAALAALPGTSVVWLARDPAPQPYRPIENDPLPGRARLYALANRLAAGAERAVRFVPGATIERFERAGIGEVAVTIRAAGADERLRVDRVVAMIGYRPRRGLLRELQLHECYASEGPMALAASLLDDAAGDCLAQRSAGPDALRTPEPGLFVLGSKSYGRNPDFLIRLGFEQVRDVFRAIEGDPTLDLHAGAETAADR